MSFLSPLALLLTGAASVPIILHLLRRKTGERVDFPAVRYLLRAQREFSRSLKLKNLLLMVLRTAAVLLVALAAARPVGRIVGGSHAPTALAIVLDNSLSSSAVVNGTPVLAGLKDEARAALAVANASDRVWIVTADGRVVGGELDAVRAAVDRTEPFGGAGDPRAAVARAVQLVQGSGLPARQVAILTDGQATTWSAPTSLNGVQATVYAPTTPPPRNRGVVRAVAEPPHWTPRGTVRATSTATDSATFRVMIAGRASARGTAAPGSELAVRLQPGDRGWIAGAVELEPDEMRGDDVRWFAVHVGAAPAVNADGDAGQFARTAIDALAQEGRVTKGNEVVITGGETARKPGVIFAPASAVQVGAANRALQRAGIPWRFGAAHSGPAPVHGNGLENVSAMRWFSLELQSGNASATAVDTLATVGGDAWAVSGEGYVLVGSALEPEATDLPLHASWVPWLGSAISDRLAGEAGAVIEAAPGAMIARPAWARELEGPDGVARPVTESRLAAPSRAGVYFWKRGAARAGAVVVNPEVAESDLTRLSPNDLRSRFTGAATDVYGDAGRFSASVFAVAGRRTLAGAFLILALLFLVAEAWATRAVPEPESVRA